MHELSQIIHDVFSGALPIVAIPGFIAFVIGALIKRGRSVRVTTFDPNGSGYRDQDVPIIGEVDSKTGKIKLY